MITNDLILKSDENTLPVMAGEVLQPRNSKHNFIKAYETGTGRWKRCRNCNHVFHADTPHGNCEPDPIDCTDWNVAMKWRDWAVEKLNERVGKGIGEMEFANLIDEAMGITSNHMIIATAKPIYYIKAVCLCVIQEGGE